MFSVTEIAIAVIVALLIGLVGWFMLAPPIGLEHGSGIRD
jgi:hypothetical protein